MLKELGHFLVNVPKTLVLKSRLSHAEFYDTLMERGEEAGLADWRRRLVEGVRGPTLEIGCGTGLMFPHYDSRVRLSALELDPEFLSLAAGRRQEAAARIDLMLGRAEDLPFADASFEFVISALVLCSVQSVERVLAEIARVLQPGGELRLIEHVRSERRVSGALMDVFNPLWLSLNQQNCHMNRETVSLIEANGFEILDVEAFKVYSPGVPSFPLRWIRARPNRGTEA